MIICVSMNSRCTKWRGFAQNERRIDTSICFYSNVSRQIHALFVFLFCRRVWFCVVSQFILNNFKRVFIFLLRKVCVGLGQRAFVNLSGSMFYKQPNTYSYMAVLGSYMCILFVCCLKVHPEYYHFF